jgi:ribosome modulation factor
MNKIKNKHRINYDRVSKKLQEGYFAGIAGGCVNFL